MTFVFGLDLIMMAILSYCHGLEFSDYLDFLLHRVSVSDVCRIPDINSDNLSNQNSNEKFSLQLALMPTDCGALEPDARCRYVKCSYIFK